MVGVIKERTMINTGRVLRIVQTTNALGIVVENPDEKLPLGRSRQRT